MMNLTLDRLWGFSSSDVYFQIDSERASFPDFLSDLPSSKHISSFGFFDFEQKTIMLVVALLCSFNIWVPLPSKVFSRADFPELVIPTRPPRIFCLPNRFKFFSKLPARLLKCSMLSPLRADNCDAIFFLKICIFFVSEDIIFTPRAQDSPAIRKCFF